MGVTAMNYINHYFNLSQSTFKNVQEYGWHMQTMKCSSRVVIYIIYWWLSQGKCLYRNYDLQILGHLHMYFGIWEKSFFFFCAWVSRRGAGANSRQQQGTELLPLDIIYTGHSYLQQWKHEGWKTRDKNDNLIFTHFIMHSIRAVTASQTVHPCKKRLHCIAAVMTFLWYLAIGET